MEHFFFTGNENISKVALCFTHFPWKIQVTFLFLEKYRLHSFSLLWLSSFLENVHPSYHNIHIKFKWPFFPWKIQITFSPRRIQRTFSPWKIQRTFFSLRNTKNLFFPWGIERIFSLRNTYWFSLTNTKNFV